MSSRTVVVLAESDSFIAWADNLMLRAPASWGVTRLIVGFPTNPTARQLDELTERSGESNWNLIKFADVASRIMILKADVVILACSGPLVALLTKRLNQRLPSVLLVNAIPGIALPLTKRAIARRTGVHVFIAHSRRERREFAAALGPTVAVALATLPEFGEAPRPPTEPVVVRRVLFAEQTIVPATHSERERLVDLLAQLPVDEVVIKQRVLAGDPSTHADDNPLAAIVQEREVRIDQQHPHLRCVAGPLHDALSHCDGVLTVSSTAALTALSSGIPAGFIADFGVGGTLKNDVVATSAMLVDLAAERDELALAPPDPVWLADNYFHGREHDDWVHVIESTSAAQHVGRDAAGEPVTEIKTRLKATRAVRSRMKRGDGRTTPTRSRGGKAIALIESPFQLLSLIEAVQAGVVDSPPEVVVPEPMKSGLFDLAAASGIELGSCTVETSLTALLRRVEHAAHLLVGDGFSGRAQMVMALQSGRRTTLLDDGASSLHLAAALRDDVRMIRPRVAQDNRRLALSALARRSLRRTTKDGLLTMFTAFAVRPNDTVDTVIVENDFEWTRRVELPEPTLYRPRVVFGSAMCHDGLISPASYHWWLERSIVAGATSFIPHRRETEDVCDFVRDLGAVVGPRGGLPAELTTRDASDLTEFRTLPSTVALTLPLVRRRCLLVCDPVQAHWWTPAAPPPLRSLLSSVARRAADRDEIPESVLTFAS